LDVDVVLVISIDGLDRAPSREAASIDDDLTSLGEALLLADGGYWCETISGRCVCGTASTSPVGDSVWPLLSPRRCEVWDRTRSGDAALGLGKDVSPWYRAVSCAGHWLLPSGGRTTTDGGGRPDRGMGVGGGGWSGYPPCTGGDALEGTVAGVPQQLPMTVVGWLGRNP
jgi:hypothetical protein